MAPERVNLAARNSRTAATSRPSRFEDRTRASRWTDSPLGGTRQASRAAVGLLAVVARDGGHRVGRGKSLVSPAQRPLHQGSYTRFR